MKENKEHLLCSEKNNILGAYEGQFMCRVTSSLSIWQVKIVHLEQVEKIILTEHASMQSFANEAELLLECLLLPVALHWFCLVEVCFNDALGVPELNFMC